MRQQQRLTAEFIAELTAAAQGEACPRCRAVGSIDIVERVQLGAAPEPSGVRFAYGPHGLPLWAQCAACGSRGRVAEIPRNRLPT